MTRTVYVNGEYLPETEAKVSIFDRGFLFGDAVYEVAAVLEGKLADVEEHLARLERSSKSLYMKLPVSREELIEIHRELIKRNNLEQGAIYLQLTRGSEGDRIFGLDPNADIEPTLVLFTQAKDAINAKEAKEGIPVISMEDIRWKYRDVKVTSLLAACLGKKAAQDAGAKDVWWVENGYVTEGGSNNAYILTQDNTIVTTPLSKDILPGITRWRLLQCMEQLGFKVEERKFTLEEVHAAKEAFISSATSFVWPVVSMDGKAIGDGKVGPVATQLREAYIKSSLEALV